MICIYRRNGPRRTCLPEKDLNDLHPALAESYHKQIAALADSLNHEATKSETSGVLRGLVSEVRLHPDDNAPDGHVVEIF